MQTLIFVIIKFARNLSLLLSKLTNFFYLNSERIKKLVIFLEFGFWGDFNHTEV